MKTIMLCAVASLFSLNLLAQGSRLIAPIQQSYEDFPEAKDTHKGMKVLTIFKDQSQIQ
jgi:hypothetical protein